MVEAKTIVDVIVIISIIVITIVIVIIVIVIVIIIVIFISIQLVEDFQQRAVAAGSEDAASVATLQKCEELLPGEVIIIIIIVISYIIMGIIYIIMAIIIKIIAARSFSKRGINQPH